MAKQIIDIGVQGNDGTGDSIRESFRKVNENFTELYAAFGVSGKLFFTSLGDAPASYTRDQIIMASTDGATLTARTLVAGNGITISGTTASGTPDDTQLIISSSNAGLLGDIKPALGQPLNANLFAIGRVPDPSPELVTIFNSIHTSSPTTIDQLAISKGYADRNYIRAVARTNQAGDILDYTIEPGLKVKDQPLTPQTTDPDYDPSLTGNYVATEVMQRRDSVYRGGDTMQGKLILADHPAPLEGYGTPNGTSDLQAATKFYVDNQVFSSGVNLYVSTTTGDDLQQRTPVGKEGRFWQYAYKTIGAAALQAENLIDLASQEPGPYRQLISYTIGPDQFFSTIQGFTLTGGNSGSVGYQDAYDLLLLNKEFLQKETVAYINNKYVNTFTYDRNAFKTSLGNLINGVGYDLVLGTNYNTIRETTTILDGVEPNSLVQTIEAIKFTRDQILDFSYGTTEVSNYIDDVIDAVCFDLIFQSNFQTIQIGLSFNQYATALSNEQIVLVLDDLKNKILLLPEVIAISTAVELITNNFNLLIAYFTTGELPNVRMPNLPTTPTGRSSARDLLLNNINFIQAEAVSFLNSEYPNLPYNRVEFQERMKYIIWSIVYDLMYGGNQQSVITGKKYWDTTTISITSTNANTDLITASSTATLAVGQPIVFNGTGFGNIQAGTVYYVASIVDSSKFSISETRGGILFPLATASGSLTIQNRIISGAEVFPTIDVIEYINSLSQNIVTNTTPVTLYQQSVKQFRNETLTGGSIAVSSISANLNSISDIIESNLNVSITTPNVGAAPSILQTVRTEILSNKSDYKTEAITFVNNSFPVINDPVILGRITDLFQDSINLLTLGITNREVPNFTSPGSLGTGYTNARALLIENLDFVADEVAGWLATNEPSYVLDPLYDEEKLIRNVKDFIEAACYELTYSTYTLPTNAVNAAAINRGLALKSQIYNANTQVFDQIYVNAITYAQDLALNVIVNASPVQVYSTTPQYKNLALSGGSIASSGISSTFSLIINISKGNTVPAVVQPLLTSYGQDFRDARGLIVDNAELISDQTIGYLDNRFRGGFSYDEATCARDVGLITDGLAIDIITGGTYQAVFAGKSYYRNASAKAVAIGTQFAETTDALRFYQDLVGQVLTQTVASRYQTATPQYFNPLKDSDPGAISAADTNMNIILSIIENGIGAAPVPSFGTGIWNVTINNGGNGYVDQGTPGNNDIIPAKVIVGADAPGVTGSGAYASIVKYVPGVTSTNDTLQVRLTKPGFFKIGERVEFGETVKDLQITIFVESGIYFEDLPIRLAANVSIKGDEFRRTIVRPRDRVSQSPWRKIFFYRDAVIDALELGLYDYSVDFTEETTPSGVVVGGTGGKIAITLNVGQVPSSWIGKIFMDDYLVQGPEKRGRAQIDSVSGNVMNCSVIYPFQQSGAIAAGDWHIYGTVNYGRHYLTDPLDINSPAKNNKEMDMFLCNDAVRISNVTMQGQGGFAMVLDPEGQIKTKSPYGQVCSSFSQSTNRKRFSGGQFIDGMTGRLFGTIVDVVYDSITLMGKRTDGSGYTDGIYNNVTLVATDKNRTKGRLAKANIVVSGGEVDSFTLVDGGKGYVVGDVLTDDGTLGAGVGFTIEVLETTDNGNGITITVQGSTNSGLDIRPPQPPCAFFVQGARYQINDVVSFDSTTATVVLTLDVGTPYNVQAFYDNDKFISDIAYILDASTFDMVIGSNYQSIAASRIFGSDITVVNNQKTTYLSGFNKTKQLALESIPAGEDYDFARSELTNRLGIILNVIDQGLTAAPAITYPFVTGLSTAKAEDLKDNILANKSFIQQEITAWIAENYIVKNIPNYNSVVLQRDVGYILDAMCYDIMYGGNAMSYDIAGTYRLNGNQIAGREAVIVAAYTRLRTVLQQIATNTLVTRSNGNVATQSLGTAILVGDPEYAKITTLVNLINDYIFDGDFDTPTTRTTPTIGSLDEFLVDAKDSITADQSTIQSDVLLYLNTGGGLRINIEGGGNKSMLANDFAMINDLGYAIVAKNGGITEQVSTFTYYCHTHYWAADGGQIRSVAGSNAHGTYGLRASGYDVTERPDSVNLSEDMVQNARVYKQGIFATEMTPTISRQALSVFITNYSYVPYNISELEIDHTLAGGGITRYEITSIEFTTVTIGGFTILKLNLSTAGNNGTSSSGLAYPLYDGQVVTIRVLQNIKFYNIDNVKPTRPSTALQYVDNLASIYRVIAYNLTESTGELLPPNVAVLQTDSSFDYYKFVTDLPNLSYVDPDFGIEITGVSGNGTTATLTFDEQAEVPYQIGDMLRVQGIVPAGYNGLHRVTNCTTTSVSYASTVTSPLEVPGVIGTKTMGSMVGDYKIAVIPVATQTTIDQINKGIYLFSYAGRSHRIVSYTPPILQPSAQYVNGGVVSTTMTISSVFGTIVPGMRVNGEGFTTQTVVSYTPAVAPSTEATIVLSDVANSAPSGTITFGIPVPAFISVDPNPSVNLVGDGTAIPALSYKSKVVPATGKKFVTYDIAWTPDSLPIVDTFYKIEGQANPNYNGYRRVANSVSKTQLTVEDTTGLTVGMVMTSINPEAFVPPSTIIQSIDGPNKFTVSPACFVPAGSTISSTVVAVIDRIEIINAGAGYTTPPVLTIGSIESGNATVQGVATADIDPSTGSIIRVNLVFPGYGYTSVPDIKLSEVRGGAQLQVVLSATATQSTTATSGVITNEVTVAYDSDPGDWIEGKEVNITGLNTKSGAGPFSVTLNIATQTVSPQVGSYWEIIGNANPLYNGFYVVTSATTGTVTFSYPVDPGSFAGSQTRMVLQGTAVKTTLGGVSLSTPTTYEGADGYAVTMALETTDAVAEDAYVQIRGNNNTLYNGFRQVISSSSNSVTLFYPFKPDYEVVASGYDQTTGTGPYFITLFIPPQPNPPAVGQIWHVSGNSNSNYNGPHTVTASSEDSITLEYASDPGVYGTGTTVLTLVQDKFNVVSFTSKTLNTNGTAVVNLAIANQAVAPLVGSTWVVSGNSNFLYNTQVTVVDSTVGSISLLYPYDPGIYGTGTTALTNKTLFLVTGTTATSESLGLNKPFEVDTAYTIRAGFVADTFGQVTTRISTCRATGHDFLDIGTGGYSTTNYPTQIYGNPAQSRQPANEVFEEGVGRVFYVTTDQNGIFRVGRFFTVDQGTGTVTFSASIALSNLDGLGFKRGVVISEFSTDSTMTNNAPEIVPVQSAVRGYIDKRLGLDHGGGTVANNNLVGPGYLPLNGALAMKGSLNMGTFGIGNLSAPIQNTDATTKLYVDTAIANVSTLAKLQDVVITSPVNGDTWAYDTSLTLNITGAFGTGNLITFQFADQGQILFKNQQQIIVTGVIAPGGNPIPYNGTWVVESATTNSVSVSGSATNTYSSGGVIQASAWRNTIQPTGHVRVTYRSRGVPLTVTGATKSGTGPWIVRYTFSSTTAPEVGVGFTVSGNSNAAYNGYYVSVASSSTFVDLQYPTDPGTYGTGTTTLQVGGLSTIIQPRSIVNSMVSETAAIAQSKLAMTAASIRANATGITQADLGLASFFDKQFSATNGWIRIRPATDATTGVTLDTIQFVSANSVLANVTGSNASPTEVTTGKIVEDGNGVRNSSFGAIGAMVVNNIGNATTASGVTNVGGGNSYGVIGITTSGSINSIVRTTGTGDIVASGFINGSQIRVDNFKIFDTTSSTLDMFTPGGFQYGSAVGADATDTVVSFAGREVNLIASSLKSNTLYAGDLASATGTIRGIWSLTASSEINFTNGTLKSNTLTTGADNLPGTIQGFWSLSGTSRLQATYADLAEYYEGDQEYEPGTVLVFGGEKEVTTTTFRDDTRAAGVVTTAPAYVMNSEQTGIKVCLALAGRVPCKVVGRVKKGDMLTTSATPGHAVKSIEPKLGSIIGKALEDKDYGEAGVIQVAVGRV